MKYTERTIYKKARKIGCRVEKGYTRNRHDNSILNDGSNNLKGYMFYNSDKTPEYGSYDADYTHLWTLQEVEDYLIFLYTGEGLKY